MTDYQRALSQFSPVTASPVTPEEHRRRLDGLQARMQRDGVRATWLDASSALTYYTGIRLGLSERIHGALVPATGPVTWISPEFEKPKLLSLLHPGGLDRTGTVATWEEDEDPFALILETMRRSGGPGQSLAIDPATPFRFAAELMRDPAIPTLTAGPMIAAQRQIKSPAEIALIQTAMDASFAVQRAVHAGLRPGLSTTEVAAFVNAAHKALGLKPLFVAVQFGEATAYPHGVPEPQILSPGDMVLVDMGGTLHGYCSDITRSYVFGTPSPRQRFLWETERDAQAAAFAAARPGARCADVDQAARAVIEAAGFGPDHALPGLPHRTGHGLGLDIHEEPFIVRGNAARLEPGMCFSIEPMLCVYGECGVRLEDILYMTDTGPRWFCQPATDPETPFAPAGA